MYKQYTIECSNTPDYTRPLKNELRIVRIVAQDMFEATEKARERFSEYENFRIIKAMREDKEKQREDYFKELGEDLGYLKQECINCGRARVVKYSSGRKICEKCSFDQDKKEYDDKYRYYVV